MLIYEHLSRQFVIIQTLPLTFSFSFQQEKNNYKNQQEKKSISGHNFVLEIVLKRAVC